MDAHMLDDCSCNRESIGGMKSVFIQRNHDRVRVRSDPGVPDWRHPGSRAAAPGSVRMPSSERA